MSATRRTQTSSCHVRLFATVALGFTAACGGTAQETNEQSISSPESTMPASATTRAELGVSAWSIQAGTSDQDADVVALGESGSKVAQFQLHSDPSVPDTVQVSGVYPDKVQLTLTRDGLVLGDGPSRMVHLTEALWKDTAEGSVADGRPSVAESSSLLGVTQQAATSRRISYEGFTTVSGGLFGTSKNMPMGGSCKDGYTRTAYDAWLVSGSGNCYVKAWLSNSEYDCRVILHFGQKAFHSGTCYWGTYQNG